MKKAHPKRFYKILLFFFICVDALEKANIPIDAVEINVTNNTIEFEIHCVFMYVYDIDKYRKRVHAND